MAYEFQAIDISLFDFHLMLDPLINPASINNKYSFLVDPASYNQQYSSGASVQTGNFKLSPLKWRTLNFHHFWKYYQTIWPAGGSYDFWKLQMPFVGKVSQTQIDLNTGSPDYEGTVFATTFVTGMGWSTNLDIHLRGKLTPTQVVEFVSRLSNKGASMFVVNGKAKILPEVFKYFAECVHKELYASNAVHLLKIMRHLIITLASFTGPIAPYLAKGKQIPAADRALFHSILKGGSVGFDEVIDLENEEKFLLTQFNSRPDFAITYFDYGTLLFMQETALGASQQGRAARSKMKCHSSNIRNYLITTLDLHSFRRDAKKTASLNGKVKTLRDDALLTLQEIPKKYSNQFCRSFHNTFGPLS